MLTKKEAAEAVRQAKVATGVTWAQLAEAVGRPSARTTPTKSGSPTSSRALTAVNPTSPPAVARVGDRESTAPLNAVKRLTGRADLGRTPRSSPHCL